MRARIDDGSLSPWELIEGVYTEESIRGLATRFDFDPDATTAIRELRDAGARYILGRRMEDEVQVRKEERAMIQRWLRETEGFLETLERLNEYDIQGELYYAARALNEPPPTLPQRLATKENLWKGSPYFVELRRQAAILQHALADQVRRLTSRGGRPRNEGMDILITRVADFWVMDAKNRFSIDHHKGKGLTEAFEFVRALLDPIDDIPDTQIVTAMRGEIRFRRAHNIPT